MKYSVTCALLRIAKCRNKIVESEACGKSHCRKGTMYRLVCSLEKFPVDAEKIRQAQSPAAIHGPIRRLTLSRGPRGRTTSLDLIIGRLARDNHVVHVALAQPC